ncbi:MAG: lipoprotein-releasing ABC transporter permease subunit [Rickettsiales bacterium]
MFSYPERLLAWRYIRSKRREGFVSVIALFSTLGILLGVATLILVTSLMNGIREEMLSNFIGVDGHITIYGNGARVIANTQGLKDTIKTIPEVKSVAERLEGQVMASGSVRALGAQVIGFKAEDLSTKDRIVSHITTGEIDGEGLLVGARLAESLGLKVGDMLTLISPEGRQTFAGMVPRIKAYPIAATFSLGMHSLDSSVIFMPWDEAMVYFQLPQQIEGGAAHAMEITLTNLEDATRVAAEIQQKIGPNFRVYDWQQSNQSVFTALKVQRDVMFVILTLIILVAAFTIISSLIMLVNDKTRDIAILRTMGATRGAILRIFLMSGMSAGIVGVLIGVPLGMLAAAYIDSIRKFIETLIGQEILVGNIYFLSNLPTKTDPSDVIMITLLTLVICFFATLYPAWKASSKHPAEALRYE